MRKYMVAAAVGIGVAAALITISEIGYQRSANILASQVELQELYLAGSRLGDLLTAAESAQRGYLLTGEDSYLHQYQTQAKQAHDEFDRFIQALEDVPGVHTNVTDLDTKISTKLSEMAIAVNLRQQGHVDASLFVTSTDVGRMQMGAITQQLESIRQAQQRLSADNVKQIRAAQDYSRVGLAMAAFTGLLAFLLYLRQSLALQQSVAKTTAELERERALLEAEVRARTADLRELATYLQQSREVDRARLAHELHDELGALLTSAKLNLARVKSKTAGDPSVQSQLTNMSDALNQVIAIKRRIIEDLRPSSLDNFGLVIALEILTREFAERAGITVNANIEAVTLNADSQLALYRLVQESLTNVAKYANATQVDVDLRGYRTHVELTVHDNGTGFDTSVVKPKSHGLAGMRHRTESINGKLEIRSKLGAGTTIFAAVPLLPEGNEAPPSPPVPTTTA